MALRLMMKRGESRGGGGGDRRGSRVHWPLPSTLMILVYTLLMIVRVVTTDAVVVDVVAVTVLDRLWSIGILPI
jgi:hypothetical protein